MSKLAVASLTLLSFSAATLHHIPLVTHHAQKRRRSLMPSGVRRRNARGLQQQVGALYQGYGTHYVDLWVGTPPQRQTVIVDTGSGVTAFPCSACDDCGESHHTDHYFIEGDSPSFYKLTCDECKRGRCSEKHCKIGMSYQEGSSWSAYEAIDIAYIGGPHTEGITNGRKKNRMEGDIDPLHANRFSFRLDFGCQTRLTGLFKTQLADGIMGMDNAKSSFWTQAYDGDVIKRKNFSLCFARQPTASREGTEAGALTLGGYDKRLHHDKENGMVFTPMSSGRTGFFSVHLRRMYLREGGNGDSAKMDPDSIKIVPLAVKEGVLNAAGTIVDSGTTDTYFSRRIQSAFNDAWAQFVDKPYNHNPVALSDEELDNLPTILIQMEGDVEMNSKLGDANNVVGLAGKLDPENPTDIVLAVPPSHYMEWDLKAQKYVARFYVTEGGGSVLGANSMMGHDVNFDVDNGRIGWAESNCDYTKLVNENGSTFSIEQQEEEEEKKEVEEEEKAEGEEEQQQEEEEKAIEEEKEVEEAGEETNESEEKVAEKKPYEDDKKSPLDGLSAPIKKAADSCRGTACRAGVVAALLGVLVVVLAVVKRVRRKNAIAYHATELEVSSMAYRDDPTEEDFGRYRDNPEGDVGYHDAVVVEEDAEKEFEPEAREIA